MAVAGKPGAAHAAIVPGMLSISLVGDRLRDRLEPTLRWDRVVPLASRVVLFGFDGLRPDRVTPGTMPHLARFMAEGTCFATARSVFPSETRVAIPSLATGCRPGTHGLVANSLYDADAAPGRVLNTKHAADIDALIAAHGRLLAVPSLGARLAAAGHALDLVWTGTVGAGRALFPEAEALDAFRWHPEEAAGPARGLAARFGEAPPPTTPNTPRVRHAARLFLEHVLGERRATVAAFWSSEPDVTCHDRGVGSAEAAAAMRDVDAAFAEVLRWRELQPDRDGIVVIALSDHGHVTGEAQLDLQAALRAGGFAAGRDFGATIQSPADLTDIAPSVLALLGLASDGMDGRALSQAWGEAGDANPVRAVIHPVAGRPGLRIFRLGSAERPDAMP